ncbi:MAG: isoleucine--tRNA ligase [Flavobacteriales bacterium]|nr:isoleucine--tRNA ligase [Flavobacteriales bacterium]MEB2341055.1 isoleucine--tRNA ligase [Flavobacteriia bacterium]
MGEDKRFPQYDELDLPKVAADILQQWEAEGTFGQSLELRKDAEPFVFYEGPPSANGLPGIHHVMARTIKDIFCRFQTQQGKRVDRKAGWDTHGLPVELGVEKELGITKEDIGKKISVEDYNRKCREAVMRYTDVWNELTKRIGFWLDMQHPYVTYRTPYIESVWWLLKQLHSKDLLYKGYTIQPYSPAAGTGLSSHELNQPGTYKPVKDTTVVAQFKVKRDTNSEFLFQDAFGEVYIIAWTTTPWTLPSNTALTVGPKLEYVRIKTFNPYTHAPQTVVLAKSRMAAYFNAKDQDGSFADYKRDGKHIPWTITGECYGHQLEGIRYEQLFDFAQPKDGDAFRVIGGDFVTTEDGTGVVHTAPSFGADDMRVARQHGIGSLTLVDLQGRFTKEMGPFAGKYVKNEYYPDGSAPEKSVDVELSILLKERGQAFKVEKYEHNYPHCWRTDKPVLYYPLDSWFVRSTAAKERMVELNRTIQWKPESTGTGRFGNWLENLQDWNLSRSRYWGIPLPIWRTEDGSEELCIGTLAELKAEVDKAVKAGLMQENPLKDFDAGNPSAAQYEAVDLHKPYVDRITLVSPSGKPMKRESDLIDVWFDSGSMPYAQWGLDYAKLQAGDPQPFKAPFPTSYPAEFIAEGVDQTRGWFFTLHAISTLVFDQVAYRTVVSNGLVLDKNGQKMSKRLGNAVDPFKTLDAYGADAVRWYMISNASPWDNLKFDAEGITEVQRKFFRALFNTYGFFALYANIDNFIPPSSREEGTGDEVHSSPLLGRGAGGEGTPQVPMDRRTEMDRWVLSRLNSLIKQVQAAYADYEPTVAARAIQDFTVEDLSNWYVRLNRRRFWKGEQGDDKNAAFQTLHRCLEVVAMLSAPIAPFYSDRLYRDLTGGSVHLSAWPKHDDGAIDLELERRTALAQRLTSLVLSIRKKEGHRVRQPLRKMMVPALDAGMRSDLAAIRDLVLSEVNVKELEVLDPEKSGLNKKIKADFKKLGARLGKNMKAAAAAIAAFDQATINTLEQLGHIRLELDGEPVDIQRDEVEITAEDVPGLSVASEGGLTVAVDITLDDELVQEGLARELVSRIQALRKDSGLEVTDRIRLQIQRNGGGAFEKAVQVHAGRIVAETLAITPEDELLVNTIEPSFSAPVEIEVEGVGKCLLALTKAVS